MKLDEIKKTVHPKHLKTEIQPYMLQTKEEIEAWMKKLGIEGFVSRELTIHSTRQNIDVVRFGIKKEDILINHNGKWVLPVQFHLAGKFDINMVEVESPIGFPYVIMEQLNAKETKFETFEGLPNVVPIIDGSSTVRMKSFAGLDKTTCNKLNWSCKAGIDSLDGLPKNLEQFMGSIEDSTIDVKDIFARCPDLEALAIGGDGLKLKNILTVFKFKKLDYFYLRPGHTSNEQAKQAKDIIEKYLKGDRNVIACQEELFKNDLDDFAV